MEPDMHQYNHRQGQPVSGNSMASMICGIVGLPAICCGVLGAPIPFAAVICGHIGMKDLKDNPEKTGKGLAITGLILGYLTILITVGFYVVLANMGEAEREEMMESMIERVTGQDIIMPSEIELETSDSPLLIEATPDAPVEKPSGR